MNSARTYTVGIAGTTQYTALCATELFSQPEFTLVWALTPPPAPVGRKKMLTPNPLHSWAEQHHLPVHTVEKKLSPDLEQKLLIRPDFLLVVDFGYRVPQWLLDFPKVAPINIHPSLLPRWRGSSPGQFCLLYGEKESAVTMMIMGAGLDTGPILRQDKFVIDSTWSQSAYYQFSFNLASQQLAQTLMKLANGTLSPTPQLEISPTPLARRLKKEDGYIDWQTLEEVMKNSLSDANIQYGSSQLFADVVATTHQNWADVIVHACHGLAGWPGVWTILPMLSGSERVKIIEAKVTTDGKIELVKVQFAGEKPKFWKDVPYSF